MAKKQRLYARDDWAKRGPYVEVDEPAPAKPYVEKWNDETQRYEPVEDAYEAFQLASRCVYPITKESHPVRWSDPSGSEGT